MSNYMTETQILSKLGIPDFRHMSKDKILAFASMIQDMDPEVAKAAIQQFPNFTEMVLEVMHDYKSSITSLSDHNNIISNNCLSILNNIIEALKECSSKGDIPFEERKYYIDKMIEISEKIVQMEKENREFNLQALVLGFLTTILIPAIASSLLGGNLRVRNVT